MCGCIFRDNVKVITCTSCCIEEQRNMFIKASGINEIVRGNPVTSVQINGDEWSVLVLHDEDYEKKHGNDSVGTTEVKTKVITLRESNSAENETIRHEIYHCYYDYLCLGSSESISLEDLEEINAEFYAKNVIKMEKTVEEVKKIVEYYKSFK